MPEEFESLYRVVGFGDKAKRIALYDLQRDDSVWVNTVGYDDDINDVLEEVETGNVLDAVVTDSMDVGPDNEYWNFLDVTIEDDSLLYYVETDGYAPGPVDGIWDERETGSTHVTAGRSDDADQRYLYELHVQDDQAQVDGDLVDVFTGLQTGQLLTEPFFEGSGCEYINNARAVIVVDPVPKEYVVMYLFPDQEEKFKDIWGSLYDYVTEE